MQESTDINPTQEDKENVELDKQGIINFFKENKHKLISGTIILMMFVVVYNSYNLGRMMMCQQSKGIFGEDGKCYFPQYDHRIELEGDTIIINKNKINQLIDDIFKC